VAVIRPSPTPSDLLAVLRAMGTSTAHDLRARLGDVRQPTFSRLVRATGGEVLRLGARRNARYAALRPLLGLGARWPVVTVNEEGATAPLGEIATIEPRGCAMLSEREMPAWMLGVGGDGLFDGLPVICTDLRPQGFLGRASVASLHGALDLPARLDDWRDHHVLSYLIRAGYDCPGNLIIGEQAYAAFARRQLEDATLIDERDRQVRYGQLADSILTGAAPGSSAGGEQPKFTAMLRRPPQGCSVLVKFSPSLGTPAGERWADLLACEHLAHGVLAAERIPSATSQIIDGPSRRFLEVERFDRIGLHGRRAIVSLLALDLEYEGELDTWPKAATRLVARGWLSASDAETLTFLWLFGGFIANTDRHFGNVSLLPGPSGMTIAPIYDMLPMLYAPVGPDMPERTYEVPVPLSAAAHVYGRAGRAAHAFWQQVEASPLVSRGFRGLAGARALDTARALERLGLPMNSALTQ